MAVFHDKCGFIVYPLFFLTNCTMAVTPHIWAGAVLFCHLSLPIINNELTSVNGVLKTLKSSRRNLSAPLLTYLRVQHRCSRQTCCTHKRVHTPSPSIHLSLSIPDHILIYYSWHLLFISFPTVLLPPCCVATSLYHRLHPSILLASPLCPSNASFSPGLLFVLYTHPLSLSPAAKFFIEL